MRSVSDDIREKHLKPCKAKLNYLVSNRHPKKIPYHQSIFENLNASKVRKSAMKTQGSHGPSNFVANEWRRLLNCVKLSSSDLCKQKATSTFTFLLLYNLCILIALDKCPSLRQLRIGKVRRQAIERTFIKTDSKLLVGDQQLFLGEKVGNEPDIHSLRAASKNTDSERSRLSTQKTLSMVSTVIFFHETLRNYALLSIIPYVNHILNHQFFF